MDIEEYKKFLKEYSELINKYGFTHTYLLVNDAKAGQVRQWLTHDGTDPPVPFVVIGQLGVEVLKDFKGFYQDENIQFTKKRQN